MSKSSNLKITCLGDLAPVKSTADFFLQNELELKKHFENMFAGSDIVFGNLETPLMNREGEKSNKKYVFRASPEILNTFPDQFVLSIANNHICDQGVEGLLTTIKHLENSKIRFTGAGRNLSEASKPVKIRCKGKNIGYLACADPRYQAAGPNNPGTFPALPSLLLPKVQELKESVDLVYVSIHMGMEFIPVPTPEMLKLAQGCKNSGADVVFFHHAHCVSGYTLQEGKTVLWGLGNFVFPKKKTYPVKSWSEAVAWHSIYSSGSGEIQLNLEYFTINEHGVPTASDKESKKQTAKKIERISRKINGEKSLTMERIKAMFNYSYLKIVMINYSDIARRNGVAGLFKSVLSSVKILFLKKEENA